MNEAIAFDTHRYIKRLTQVGFTEQQAETLADEQVSLIDSNLAIKADLMSIKAEIEKVKPNLLKWMIGALIAQAGLIVTLTKVL